MLCHFLFLTESLLHAPILPVFFELTFLLLDDVILQGREVLANLHLDLLLGHVFEFLVLLVHGKSLRVINIPKFVVLAPVVLLFLLFSLLIMGLKVVLKGLELPEAGIEPILNVIVDASRHQLLNLDPLVAILLMELHKLEVLSESPLFLVKVGINIVVPPLPALLADASRQEGGNLLPLFEAVLSYLLLEHHVFLWGPVAFDLLDGTIFSLVPQLEPTVHAIDTGPERFIFYLRIQELTDDLYVLDFVFLD